MTGTLKCHLQGVYHTQLTSKLLVIQAFKFLKYCSLAFYFLSCKIPRQFALVLVTILIQTENLLLSFKYKSTGCLLSESSTGAGKHQIFLL